MSGATLAYNLRRNKYVERQLFMELLARFSRWRSIADYLYIGMGGVYFEEFKLLHTRFRIKKMISLEREEWMLKRQKLNIPYGCVSPFHEASAELVAKVDEYRTMGDAANLLIWLDYVTARELPSQLSEVRALIPKLEHGDILKITLSLNPAWLDSGQGNHERRLETLQSLLGSTYLAEGISVSDVTKQRLPHTYIDALRRKIYEGMTENPGLEFIPLGCYTYDDGTPMLTATGALIRSEERPEFVARFGFGEADFTFTSPNWEIHEIAVPDMSLPERLEIDRKLPGKSAEEIAGELKFQFEADAEESLDLIRNYLKLYRFYPSYHRVQI